MYDTLVGDTSPMFVLITTVVLFGINAVADSTEAPYGRGVTHVNLDADLRLLRDELACLLPQAGGDDSALDSTIDDAPKLRMGTFPPLWAKVQWVLLAWVLVCVKQGARLFRVHACVANVPKCQRRA